MSRRHLIVWIFVALAATAVAVAALRLFFSSPAIDPAKYSGHPEIQEVLRAIPLGASCERIRNAIAALGDIDDPKAVDAILACRSQWAEKSRRDFLSALAKAASKSLKDLLYFGFERFKDGLIERLDDAFSEKDYADSIVEEEAAAQLWKYDGGQAMKYLCSLLDGYDGETLDMAFKGILAADCPLSPAKKNIEEAISQSERDFVGRKIDAYTDRDCAKLLRKVLKRDSSDCYVVWSCGAAIGRSCGLKDVEPMLDDIYLKAAATYALGCLGDAKAMELLARQAKDSNPDVRLSAMKTLTVNWNEGSERMFREALTDGDARVRRQALIGFPAAVHEPKERNAVALATLYDKDAIVRVEAANCASCPAPASLEEALCEMALRDPEEAARKAALRSLATLSAAKAPDIILSMISGKAVKDSDFPCEALLALEVFCKGQKTDSKPLMALKGKFDGDLRRICAEAKGEGKDYCWRLAGECLALMGDFSPLEDYVRWMGARERWLERGWDARLLFQLGDCEPWTVLNLESGVGMLDSVFKRYSSTRWEEIVALSKPECPALRSGLPERERILSGVLNSYGESLRAAVRGSDWIKAAACMGVLGTLGDSKTPLEVLLGSTNSYSLRLAAIKALGNAGDASAVDSLTSILKKGVRGEGAHAVWPYLYAGAAVESLVKLHRLEAGEANSDKERRGKILNALKEALNASSAKLRQNAAKGLGEIGEEGSLSALKARLPLESDANVRRAIRESTARVSMSLRGAAGELPN